MDETRDPIGTPVERAIEPAGPVPPRPDQPRRAFGERRWLAAVGVLAPLGAALTFPFFGPLASLATPFVAASLGPRVWPARRWKIVVASLAAIVGLWVAVFVVALSPSGEADALWLLIPLCGPKSALAFFVMPGAGVAAYGVVAAASVVFRRVWIWPIAGVGGGLAYAGAWALLGSNVSWVC
jgi:hypothetical protein